MVCYKCGSVPIGVFPGMVASLIGNTSLDKSKRHDEESCSVSL